MPSFFENPDYYSKHSRLQDYQGEKLFHIIKQNAPAADIKNILDVGCGTGSFTLKISKHFPKARVVGIDNSARTISYAQKKSARANITYVNADISLTAKGFEKNKNLTLVSWDLIVSNAAMHWILNQTAVYRYLNKIASAGSFLAVHQGAQGTYYGLRKLAEKILKRKKIWKLKFSEFKYPVRYLSEQKMKATLKKTNWSEKYFLLDKQSPPPTILNDFFNSALLPYILRLTQREKEEFKKQFLSEAPLVLKNIAINRFYFLCRKK